jgi:hypothetical protein
MFQSWVQTQGANNADGAALNTSTTATSLLPAAGVNRQPIVLPQNFFYYAGQVLRIRGAGRISNIVTTPGTFTLDVRFTTGPIVVFNGGAMQLSTTAHTNVPFRFDIDLTCRSVGSGTGATLFGQGMFFSQAVSVSGADPTTGHSFLMIPNTAPAVGNGFDSTSVQPIDIFGTFSISNAGNGVTLHQLYVESLN